MSREAWGDEDFSDDWAERASDAGWIDPVDLSKAQIDVMNERDRQWNEEGFTPDGDDRYIGYELSKAATAYLAMSWRGKRQDGTPPSIWPWAAAWWKPKSERQNLVSAAALILAEIERIDRAAAKDNAP